MLRTVMVLVLAAFGLGLGAPAVAQVVLSPQEQADNDLTVYFYRDPRPERLVDLVRGMGNRPLDWSAYPPMVGLLAVVFKAHGESIVTLTPENLTPKMADTIAAALRLSGQQTIPPAVRERMAKAGSDPTLRAQLANLPARLEDLRIVTPTHLDVLWGAFFGSGSERYVQMILDFFTATANKSELIAVDITQTTVAILGGPKTILSQLKGKYGNDLAYNIVVASSAEWALWANGRQHPTVNKVVTAYIAENPNSFAAKSLRIGLRNK